MSWITANYIKYPDNKLKLRHKVVSQDDVEATVERLNVVKKVHHDDHLPERTYGGQKMSQGELDQMLDRLADKEKNLLKTPERNRTGAAQPRGIVNSYNWTNGQMLWNKCKQGDGTF